MLQNEDHNTVLTLVFTTMIRCYKEINLWWLTSEGSRWKNQMSEF